MNESEKLNKSEAALREERVLKFWQDNKIFEKTLEKTKGGTEFVFYEGPPTANAKPALHHLEARAFKDVIPRYKTMQGFHVPRRGGWDTHGLPVELQIEKKLGLNSKKAIEEYGIEKFNKECKDSVFTYIKDWEDFTDRIGFWVDKDKAYFTFNNSYIESLWNVLAHVNKRGLLYKDYRIVPWCSRCGTPLASHELAQGYEDVKDLSIYVKFKLNAESTRKLCGTDAKSVYLLAWTTTPWTLPGNVALAVGKDIDYVKVTFEKLNSKDDLPSMINAAHINSGETYITSADFWREKGFALEEVESKDSSKKFVSDSYTVVFEHIKGSDLVGLSYEPLYNFITPNENSHKVYAADFVTTEDGTGIVHIAPMYGQDDFELGTKVGLPKQHVVGLDGKFLPGTGFFEGRFAMEKDESGKPTLAIDVIKDLQARGLFFDKKNYEHTYPHCWRCKTPLIYYARDSWYIRMSDLRDELVAQNENINWEPAHIKEGRFGEWLKDIKDWAVSRERYWGTPLPIWVEARKDAEQTPKKAEMIVVDSLETLKKYTKKSGNKYFVMRHGESEGNVAEVVSNAPHNQYDLLTQKGIEQTMQSAESLKDERIDVIISSGLTRAHQTAVEFAKVIKFDETKILTDERVNEIKVGVYEGKSYEAFHKALEDYTNSDWAFNAVPDGESLNDVRKRVGSFLYDLESEYQNKNILIVTHGTPSWMLFQVAGAANIKDFSYWYRTEKQSPTIDSFKKFNNAEVREMDFSTLPHNANYEFDLHRPFIDDVVLEKDGKEFHRVKEVMDVWFDSGAMPFAQDHYLAPVEKEKFFSRLFGKTSAPVPHLRYPADFISEAIDQTRGWFYTLHAVGVLMNKGNAYKNVICLGHLLDKDGKKMSKSVGNIVNPWEMMDKYGVDTLRLWMYSVNQPGESKNFDEKTVAEIHNKIFNLLYNVLAFYELYRDKNVEEESYKLKDNNILDVWILQRIAELTNSITANLDAYKLLEPVRELREFIDDLSTWYLRRSRDRLKNGDQDAKRTLYHLLRKVARLLAPFAPFSAEDIWQRLKTESDEESVHLAGWIEGEEVNEETIQNMKIVRQLVTMGLEARQKAGIKVRQPLQKLEVGNEKLEVGYLDLIKEELNVKEVVLGEEFKLDTNITPELKREGEYREFVRAVQDLRKKENLLPDDLVTITIPENQKETISGFEEDFRKVAGIKEIKFGGDEIKIEK